MPDNEFGLTEQEMAVAREVSNRTIELFDVLGVIQEKLAKSFHVDEVAQVPKMLEDHERKNDWPFQSNWPSCISDPKNLARLLRMRAAAMNGQMASTSFDDNLLLDALDWAERRYLPTEPTPMPAPMPTPPVRRSLLKELPTYPRAWGLLQYLLPHKARRDVFEPSHQEMLADYYAAMKAYRTRPARAWLRFCFAFRTVLMLVECYRVLGLDRVARLLPQRMRRWWIS